MRGRASVHIFCFPHRNDMSQLRRVKEQKNKIAFPKSGAASLGGGAAAAVDMYTSLPAPNPPVPKVNRIKFNFFVLVGAIVVALLCVFIFVKAQELRKCKAKQASALKCGPTTQLNTLGTECVPRSDLKRCDNATTRLDEKGVCVSKLDPLPSSKIDDSHSIDAPIIVVLVVVILVAIVFFAFKANRSTTDAASPSPPPASLSPSPPPPSASPGGGGDGESVGGGGDGASPSPPPPPGEEGGGGEGEADASEPSGAPVRWLATPRRSYSPTSSPFPSVYDVGALALGGMAGASYGKAHRVVRGTLESNPLRFREMETHIPELRRLNMRSPFDLSKTPDMDRLTGRFAPYAAGDSTDSFHFANLEGVPKIKLTGVNLGRLGPPPPVVQNSSYLPQALISGETAPGRALLQASGPPVPLPPQPSPPPPLRNLEIDQQSRSKPPKDWMDANGQYREVVGGKWKRPLLQSSTGPAQDNFGQYMPDYTDADFLRSSNATSGLLPALSGAVSTASSYADSSR